MGWQRSVSYRLAPIGWKPFRLLRQLYKLNRFPNATGITPADARVRRLRSVSSDIEN